MLKTKKLSLTARIFIAMLLGVVTGSVLKLLFGENNDLTLFGGAFSTQSFLVDGIFNIVGTIFIKSLKMLVVPLVFVSLVCGTCNLSDPKQLGALGGKSVLLYVVTTAIAISIAISMALMISPGEGIALLSEASYTAKQAPSLAQVIIDIFPSNPFEAMSQGNMLQVIVFSILFGVSIALSGEKGEKLKTTFNHLNDVMMQMVLILMKIAPYGVFCLMAKLFTVTEFETIIRLGKYFVLVLTVLFMHALITYPVLLKLLAGLNPLPLLMKMKDAVIFAFSTSSSSATLPITLKTAEQKLGVDKSVASFTVPLGATINMDGTAIMQGVATVFIAQVYGVDLSIGDYLMVVLTATLASIGTAGVPGVGLIMLAMVLQQVGLPVEGIALIIGVDRLLDMTRTAVNVTGDCTVATIVANSEGALDKDVYNKVK